MLSFSISLWDSMEFHYFADTTERADRGGWKQAQRQGEDRMTLRISLLFSFWLFISSQLLAKLVWNIPSLELLYRWPFLINYCSLPFSRSSKVDLESLWLGVSFIEVIGSYKVLLLCSLWFCLNLEPNSVLFSFNTYIPQYGRERKGDLEYQKVALIEWTLFWLSFNALKLLNFCILFSINDCMGGGTIQAWDALLHETLGQF